MLHRLCGSPSIPLSFILANVLPYKGILTALAAAPKPLRPRHLVFIVYGVDYHVSNPVCSHAFVPQCQFQSSKPPSPLMFLLISTHFTATLGIPLTSPALQSDSFKSSPRVKPWVFTSDLPYHLRTFTPSKSG